MTPFNRPTRNRRSLRQRGDEPNTAGFTLMEVMIAMTIGLVVLGGVTTAMIHVMHNNTRQMLDIERVADGQRVASMIRSNLRLTSVSEMLLYPEDPPHIAISYPLPHRNDPDDLNLDEFGRVMWGTTVIVHAWPADDPRELRMTQFRPRDTTLDIADRRDQLAQVVADGTGIAAANGENSSTRTLSRIGPYFAIQTDGRHYNFYSSPGQLDQRVNLGAVPLVSGENRVTFRPTDKAAASGGYGLILDQLRLSPAGLSIDATALPIASQSGAFAQVLEDTSGNWNNQQALSFPAGSPNAELELTFFNDTWHETTFLGGSDFDGTATYLNTESGSVGTRLRAIGRDLAWAAMFQANSDGAGATENILDGTPVRVIIRGGHASGGPHILTDGDGCTVVFRASNHPNATLHILHAYISEVIDHDNPGVNIAQNTVTRLEFGSPSNPKQSVIIGSGESVRTVPVEFPIDSEKSYAISYHVAIDSGMPWSWPVSAGGGRIDTYTLGTFPAFGGGVVRSGGWSNLPWLQSFPAIIGVAEIRTTYSDVGTYTSRIIDTGLAAPHYKDIDWSGTIPPNTAIEMQVRTGAQPDLSDAPDWDLVNTFTWPGTALLDARRYVQARARLVRDPIHDQTPELHDFTLRWHGEPSLVDFGGIFQRHTSGGLVEVLVNDEPPASTFRLEMDMGLDGPAEATSAPWSFVIEVTPRN